MDSNTQDVFAAFARLRASEQQRAAQAQQAADQAQQAAIQAQQAAIQAQQAAIQAQQAAAAAQQAATQQAAAARAATQQAAARAAKAPAAKAPAAKTPAAKAPAAKTPAAKTPAADAARKAAEEARTRALLGGVDATVVPGARVEASGLVRIGGALYARQDCGAAYGGHTNLCGYLSLAGGDGPRALELKRRLVPRANQFAASIAVYDTPVDFGAPAELADTEVFYAYVEAFGAPVVVFSEAVGVAVRYGSARSAGAPVCLYLMPGHFQRLRPV